MGGRPSILLQFDTRPGLRRSSSHLRGPVFDIQMGSDDPGLADSPHPRSERTMTSSWRTRTYQISRLAPWSFPMGPRCKSSTRIWNNNRFAMMRKVRTSNDRAAAFGARAVWTTALPQKRRPMIPLRHGASYIVRLGRPEGSLASKQVPRWEIKVEGRPPGSPSRCWYS